METVRILLIDDDERFARRLESEAPRHGATIDWYRSFAELGPVGSLGIYDCVIADLTADPVTGVEIAQYATAFFSDLPVLLIGDDDDDTGEGSAPLQLPPAVRADIAKAAGATAVLRAALDQCAAFAGRRYSRPPRHPHGAHRLSRPRNEAVSRRADARSRRPDLGSHLRAKPARHPWEGWKGHDVDGLFRGARRHEKTHKIQRKKLRRELDKSRLYAGTTDSECSG
jgi:hypothetical protein